MFLVFTAGTGTTDCLFFLETLFVLFFFRTTAFGVQGVINRLASIVGNVAFGILIQTHCAVNILLVAALLAFGGLLTLTLPKTKKISLQ